MHATERDKAILAFLEESGFIAFRVLESRLDASPATLRRDLDRLAAEGRIERVRGGAKLPAHGGARKRGLDHLHGVPFHENIHRNRTEKVAIGRAAAALCFPGTSVMIDGGSTTLQMCPNLEGLNLQVFTNSLHVVSTLLRQSGTRILVPGGSVFREQNIILSVAGDESMPRFHAPQLFMGAASVGPSGIMQADVILVTAERRLIDLAEEVVLLVDHTKFHSSSGNVVCSLEQVDTIITDEGIRDKDVTMLESHNIGVVIASRDASE